MHEKIYADNMVSLNASKISLSLFKRAKIVDDHIIIEHFKLKKTHLSRYYYWDKHKRFYARFVTNVQYKGTIYRVFYIYNSNPFVRLFNYIKTKFQS